MAKYFMAGKKLTVEEWLKLYGNGAEFTAKKKQVTKEHGIITTWIIEAFNPKARPARVKVHEVEQEESANQYIFYLRISYEEATS